MQIKVYKITNPHFMAALKKLMKLTTIPATAAFKIRGLAKECGEEVKKFEELRNSYVEEFGMRDEDNAFVTFDTPGGKAVRIKPECQKVLDEKLKELNSLVVEVPEIKIDELRGKDPVTKELMDPALSPDDYFYLEFILE